MSVIEFLERMTITYSSPSFSTASPVHSLRKLPSIEIPERSERTLSHLWHCDHEVRSSQWTEPQKICDHVRDIVNACEDRRMDRRPQLVFPFLSVLSDVTELPNCNFAYPSYPGTAIFSEYHLPCWLKRLEEFIGLEEGSDGERIENSECDQKEEDVLRRGGLRDMLESS